MKKEMLINVLQPEECRIAILEDGVLEELYVERTSHESYVGNIYKGRIVNIEPSIQAAFVDFGVGRNGFLHVSDVEPAYYRHLEQGRHGDREERGRDRGNRGEREERGRDRGDRGERGDRGDRRRGPVRYRDLDSPTPVRTELGAESRPPRAETGAEGEQAVDRIEQQTLFEAVQELVVEAPGEAHIEYASELPVQESVESAAEEGSLPPLLAHPETQLFEEELPRGRRRSRSGPRRKRPASEEQPAAGPGAEAGPEEETEAPERSADTSGSDPEAPPKPRLMDSAERRTTERETGGNNAPEITPRHPDGAADAGDEDLLFFPRSAPSPEPPAVAQPVEPSEPEAVEAEAIEPEVEAEAPPPEPEFFLPPRRRHAPPSRTSIEEDLEADLAAAEIGVDSEAAPGPRARPEPAPRTRPERVDEPVAEAGPEGGDEEVADFDEGLDARYEEEALEDDMSPPRDDRRGPPRDAGRGRPRGRDRDRDRDRRRRDGGGGRPGAGRPKPLIQDIFRRGQEVLVQVIKEGIGTKGPTLSTYISIPGRYLVLMPGLNRVGVSRKIQDEEQRRRLRDIFNEMKPPRGLGFIIRTAGIDKNKKELQRDLSYLSRLWQVVVRRIRKVKSPAEIYQESDMITRTIRDTFTNDIETIWVDEPAAFEHAQEFLQIVMPRYASRIKLYEGKEPMFHKNGIEAEIARIQLRKVPLPNGGSIVIEQTEALVAIDVNSGNFRADNNAEETAYQMNLLASREIARQLRLRDLGGVIVNDFIDMRDEKHRRNVEKAMRDAMKRDRARTKILKISAFGLIEMTRQRVRPSLKRSVYMDCPYCKGMAQVKTCESMSIEVMRLLQLAACLEPVHRVEVQVADDVANYLLNKKRKEIAQLEEMGQISVQVKGSHGVPPEKLDLLCLDHNENEVKLLPSPEETGRARR